MKSFQNRRYMLRNFRPACVWLCVLALLFSQSFASHLPEGCDTWQISGTVTAGAQQGNSSSQVDILLYLEDTDPALGSTHSAAGHVNLSVQLQGNATVTVSAVDGTGSAQIMNGGNGISFQNFLASCESADLRGEFLLIQINNQGVPLDADTLVESVEGVIMVVLDAPQANTSDPAESEDANVLCSVSQYLCR